jgi:hypothetical protein
MLKQYSSLFQRGDPEQRRISPLPGRGTTPSNASSAESNNNSGMDTYRSPPRPLAYDDPRCSLGQVGHSKASIRSHNSSEILLRSGPIIKIELAGTTAEEKFFSSCVKNVVDNEVANEVQAGDSNSSSEEEDCPICLEGKFLLGCKSNYLFSNILSR